MNRATIKQVELVNGSLISFTIALPDGAREYDFDLSALGGVLNTSMDNGFLIVNTFETETDIAAGDLLAPNGDIINGGGVQLIESVEIARESIDYRDAFAEKHNGQF
ncbi:MAG: hypothetical protein H8E27_01690 [Verrucomicrobia subdivision 3 bacterium]|nr:hypothetical protein [Limisphaerales bacterium]